MCVCLPSNRFALGKGLGSSEAAMTMRWLCLLGVVALSLVNGTPHGALWDFNTV